MRTPDHSLAGQTTYRWRITRWANDDQVVHDAGEAPSVAEATAKAASVMRHPNNTGLDLWASVRRGTYVEDPIDDDEHGTILDAYWVEEDDWWLEGQIGPDGRAAWEGHPEGNAV